MARNDQTIQTGISGLDRILFGGIPDGNLILVEGGPGSGKTLMGTEFIYRGAKDFNEPGIIVVFETSAEKLLRQALAFGWNLEELQQHNKLKIISKSPEIFERELHSPDSLLLETAGELGARRILSTASASLAPCTVIRTGRLPRQAATNRTLPRVMVAMATGTEALLTEKFCGS